MKTLFGILLAAVAVALSGCETESSDQIAISISPNNVTMKKGESREFTASGWRDYTWSLSEPSIGVLSTTKGDSTVYTAVAGPTSTNEASLSQILVLTVDVATDGVTSGTNIVSSGSVSAQALITHTP
jgi:hypothetical protein